jgi:hypothetical protein
MTRQNKSIQSDERNGEKNSEIFKKGDEIMSKRKISERQDNGEYVAVSEIFAEADEIGKMLEKSMGTERFNAALKALDEKENTQ